MFRMRWTLLLTIPAIVLSSVLGGGLGLRAGWKKGGLLDTIASPIMLLSLIHIWSTWSPV